MLTVGTIGLSLTRLVGGGMVGNEKKEQRWFRELEGATDTGGKLQIQMNLLLIWIYSF